jgi:hypothetical protein
VVALREGWPHPIVLALKGRDVTTRLANDVASDLYVWCMGKPGDYWLGRVDKMPRQLCPVQYLMK